MEAELTTRALERVLEPLKQCLTPDVAKRILSLHSPPDLQARVEELAQKANEGSLVDDERVEYESYVEAFDILGILQAQARSVAADSGST